MALVLTRGKNQGVVFTNKKTGKSFRIETKSFNQQAVSLKIVVGTTTIVSDVPLNVPQEALEGTITYSLSPTKQLRYVIDMPKHIEAVRDELIK